MDHSAVTTFLEIKRAYNTSSTYKNHQPKHSFHGNCGIEKKESITIAHTLDQVWLCCQPRPVDCLHDNRTAFVSTKFQELLLQSYQIRSEFTTVKNPQANGILECMHQVIGNLNQKSLQHFMHLQESST